MSFTYGTMSTSGNSFTLVPQTNDRRPESPTGLIVTQAVETKAGWLGQVYVDKTIVFESEQPHESSDRAIREANALVVQRVTRLFDPDPQDGDAVPQDGDS